MINLRASHSIDYQVIYHILHIIQGGNVLADGQANSSLLENFCGLPTPLIFRKKMCSHV